MATEEYAIGYEEGHQAGWNSAMDSLSPQRKPLTNKEAQKLWSHIEGVTVSEAVVFLSIVRVTEAAHGIKEKT